MEFNRVLNSAYHYNILSHITRSKTNYLKTLRKTVYFSLRYNWCTINYIYLKGYFDKFTYQDNEFICYPQSFLTPIGIPPPLPFSWRRKWQPIPVLFCRLGTGESGLVGGWGMELRLPLEMFPGREAACRAGFGTWGFFRTMHGNWRAAIHGVTKSRTQLSDWSDLIKMTSSEPSDQCYH